MASNLTQFLHFILEKFNLWDKCITWASCGLNSCNNKDNTGQWASPLGPQSSCGLSMLWRTGKSLFHSAQCHSLIWNTCDSKVKWTKHILNSLNYNNIELHLCLEVTEGLEFLLMCDFKRIGVSHSISVIRLHLLRSVIGLQTKVRTKTFLRLMVPFADFSRFKGGFVIRLQVHIIDFTLKLHWQGSGRPCVNKALS